ncbi:MAG: magnesium-translocating P-type ATPase, partial [Candidatus Parcubacteria bacterium]|nr:magnesium-translocating P-type ATPase [Candidatus Parcubacteria bacterium]
DTQFNVSRDYKKIDEIPFDFERRRMSVVVADKSGQQMMICKGAVEEMLALCQSVMVNGDLVRLNQDYHDKVIKLHKNLSNDGFRVMIIGFKKIGKIKVRYAVNDEADLCLLGFLCFWDPPKPNVAQTINDLFKTGVIVKILTGDNELVTHKICQEVGLKVDKILLGRDVDALSDDNLKKTVEDVSIFARLAPNHKERVIKALRDNGHVVGYMGDGINDAPALRAADVGISVDTGVDIAKESSDIILLEKKLSVLKDGVMEGRRVFGNITKYIRMAASSNFGNMFSVVGGSIFLPFLPMLPLQILTNNMLYDFSQTTIPTDKVDEEYIMKPRKWDIKNIKRFIFYIGPISSIFDFLTYLIMILIFHAWNNPALFHTGWFIESIFTQTLIIHIIRTNKIPFIQSRASWQLITTSLLIIAVAAFLPYSPIAHYLGFVSLPLLYWFLLAGMLALYFIITQAMKSWFIKKYETT